jgi:hypothetical protein
MRKLFLMLFLAAFILSCEKNLSPGDKLPNELPLRDPRISELLNSPLIDSVVETNGTITGYFKDGRKTTYNDPTKSTSLDSAGSLSDSLVASTSSGSSVNVGFFDPPLATANPATVSYTAMVGCQLIDGYALVTSVGSMNMTVLNGSTTIYHPGSSGATTTYYTTISNAAYYHSPLYLPTVTLTWSGSKQTRTTTKASSSSPAISSTTTSFINTSRTVSASIPVTPPPN